MKSRIVRQLICTILVLCTQGGSVWALQWYERVYLQTDKVFYLSGEIVWTKMLVTDPRGVLSGFSKVGYLELLDGATPVAQVRLSLEGGVGDGYMQIPTELPTGNYRLVGYTRYLRGAGEEFFFEKSLSVVNTFRNPVEPLADPALPKFEPKERTCSISIEADSLSYSRRSPASVKIKGIPSDMATLSVSIAGVDIYQPQGMKGIVEAFTNYSHPIESFPAVGESFLPEYEGPIITGQLIDRDTESPSDNTKVRVLLGVPGDKIRLFGGQIGKNGEVTFFTKGIQGVQEVVTVATSSSSARYRVDIDSPFATHTGKSLPKLYLNPLWEETLLKRSIGLQVLYSYRGDSLLRVADHQPWFRWKPDWSYHLDEYTRFSTMGEVVQEFVKGLRFRKIKGLRRLAVLTEEKQGFTGGNTLAILDGIPIEDHEMILNYDPLRIKRIDVYKGKYLFGGQIFDGIAAFYSYNNNYPGLKLDGSTQFFDYVGTQRRSQFYAPSYSTPEDRASALPDYRHTLLWLPQVINEGRSEISIPFTTSDMVGDFLITIEGLSVSGSPFSATQVIHVR